MLRTISFAAVALAAVAAAPAAAQDYPWKPDRPVTLIVPWAAGGSTDQMARLVAAELEEALGQKFVVANQPGASGSVGTKNALEAPKDGYTWAAGAAVDLSCYRVTGFLDTGIDDWTLFFAVANVTAIAANPSSSYKDFGQLLEAMKARPGQVPVATAGLSSAGRNVMETIRANAKTEYKHVTYDGGRPAVIATVAGETPVVAQLLVEMSEEIKAKRLVPLAVQADKPIPLAGYGDLPPITKWLPSIPAPLNYFGIWVPKGVPDSVVRTMTMVWERKIANSAKLKEYAEQRSAIFAPLHGQAARDAAWPMTRLTAWLYFEGGTAKVSPDTVGIPKL